MESGGPVRPSMATCVGLEVLLKMLTPTVLDGGAEKSKVQKGREKGKIKGVYAAYGMCMSSAFGKEAK